MGHLMRYINLCFTFLLTEHYVSSLVVNPSTHTYLTPIISATILTPYDVSPTPNPGSAPVSLIHGRQCVISNTNTNSILHGGVVIRCLLHTFMTISLMHPWYKPKHKKRTKHELVLSSC